MKCYPLFIEGELVRVYQRKFSAYRALVNRYRNLKSDGEVFETYGNFKDNGYVKVLVTGWETYDDVKVMELDLV
jgi:hypothetical protein